MPKKRMALRMIKDVIRLKRRAGVRPREDRRMPATVRWAGGLRTVARTEAGGDLATDMPAAIGGEDSAPTPGWLLRPALASCAVTRIAMEAASRGIAL